ncbi:SDR family oxidoreductase [Enterococcus faecalis]
MEKNTKNKIALVTGSSRGIGKSIAQSLEKKGYTVIYHAKSKNSLDFLPSDSQIFISDFSKPETLFDSYERLYNKVGNIDVLVLNAGIGRPEQFLEEDSYLEEIIKINLTAQIVLSQAHLKMHANNLSEGQLIYISSIAGKILRPNFPFYSMTKAAVSHYLKIMSQLYLKHRVRINIISPGSIETDMTKTAVNQFALEKDITYEQAENELYKNINCQSRLGNVADVSNMVDFLVSEKSSYLNGEDISLNGGYKYA